MIVDNLKGLEEFEAGLWKIADILAFAERILPRASDLWVQSSLDYKQRLQQLFFPEGIAFDGNRFNRTAVTAPLFKYLAPSESADEKVTHTGIEPGTQQSAASPGSSEWSQTVEEPTARLSSEIVPQIVP
jgi:hypothetical protein